MNEEEAFGWFSLTEELEEEESEDERERCPECGSTRIISEDEIWICNDCGQAWTKTKE